MVSVFTASVSVCCGCCLNLNFIVWSCMVWSPAPHLRTHTHTEVISDDDVIWHCLDRLPSMEHTLPLSLPLTLFAVCLFCPKHNRAHMEIHLTVFSVSVKDTSLWHVKEGQCPQRGRCSHCFYSWIPLGHCMFDCDKSSAGWLPNSLQIVSMNRRNGEPSNCFKTDLNNWEPVL